MNDEERFWAKVRKTRTCWIWTGTHRRGHGSYGFFWLSGHNVAAHEISYRWNVGSVSHGFRVSRNCGNRSCVRPSHLSVRPVAHLTMTDPQRFWSRVQKTESCWIWSGARSKVRGYGRFRVCGMNVLTHRYAWELMNGPISDDGLVVMHACDNPQCVRPDHLRLGTKSDNTRDAAAKGRMRGSIHGKGERHRFAVLSDFAVSEIRRLSIMGATQMELAERFAVTQSAISRILSRKRWGHVE